MFISLLCGGMVLNSCSSNMIVQEIDCKDATAEFKVNDLEIIPKCEDISNRLQAIVVYNPNNDIRILGLNFSNGTSSSESQNIAIHPGENRRIIFANSSLPGLSKYLISVSKTGEVKGKNSSDILSNSSIDCGDNYYSNPYFQTFLDGNKSKFLITGVEVIIFCNTAEESIEKISLANKSGLPKVFNLILSIDGKGDVNLGQNLSNSQTHIIDLRKILEDTHIPGVAVSIGEVKESPASKPE